MKKILYKQKSKCSIEKIKNCCDVISKNYSLYDDQNEYCLYWSKAKSGYYVYVSDVEDVSSCDRFGFKILDPYYIEHFFKIEIKQSESEENTIYLYEIDRRKTIKLIKLFIFAPIMAFIIVTGLNFALLSNEIVLTNTCTAIIFFASVLISYTGVVLNILFNKEDDEKMIGYGRNRLISQLKLSFCI